MRRRAALLAVVLAVVGPAAIRAGEIRLDADYPLVDRPTRLTVLDDGRPVAGATVETRYRPNSQTATSETLPPTDDRGEVAWTPRDAGIVTLEARRTGGGPVLASRSVAVRYGRFPPSGLAIMILAGILLFGGAGLGFVLLLRPPEHIPPEEPPST